MRITLSLLLLAGLLLLTSVTRAADPFRAKVSELATLVKKNLEGEALALGDFKYDSAMENIEGITKKLNITTENGFKLALHDELQKLKQPMNSDAKHKLAGTFAVKEFVENNSKFLSLTVKATITDSANNESSFSFTRNITDEASIAQGLGLNVSFKPQATRSEHDQDIRRAILNPQSAVVGTEARNSTDSLFAIEILDPKNPLSLELKNGQPTVSFSNKQIYAIRVINRAPFEVAVRISVDGLGLFTFSNPEFRIPATPQGEPKYSVIIVDAAKDGKPGETIIQGWHRNNKAGGDDSFQVTEYSKSAAGLLNKPDNIGTITAAFQACWDKQKDGEKMPDLIAKSEPAQGKGRGGDDKFATGFGPPTGVGKVEVQREFGDVRETISVRYEVK